MLLLSPPELYLLVSFCYGEYVSNFHGANRSCSRLVSYNSVELIVDCFPQDQNICSTDQLTSTSAAPLEQQVHIDTVNENSQDTQAGMS